ncbi:MAG TPA: hypothetical protein VNO81_00815, partial [Candidatus Nitrosotenuis sp.]|nr:hypothetical protein [Candidatus Nitrosotenuis sp.]
MDWFTLAPGQLYRKILESERKQDKDRTQDKKKAAEAEETEEQRKAAAAAEEQEQARAEELRQAALKLHQKISRYLDALVRSQDPEKLRKALEQDARQLQEQAQEGGDHFTESLALLRRMSQAARSAGRLTPDAPEQQSRQPSPAREQARPQDLELQARRALEGLRNQLQSFEEKRGAQAPGQPPASSRQPAPESESGRPAPQAPRSEARPPAQDPAARPQTAAPQAQERPQPQGPGAEA